LRISVAWKVLTRFEVSLPRSAFRVSYSQSGEDMILWFLLNHLGIELPTYVDVGAHHPERLSNTALFYLLGSRGMNIEADPRLYEAFPRARPRDVNLNLGIGAEPGTLTFHRMSDPSLNTFSPVEAEKLTREHGIAVLEVLSVRVERLSSILARENLRPDFLSIDTEGLDFEVLQTFDFDWHRPAAICIESISFALDGSGRKDERIRAYLAERDYSVYADTYVNTIFVDAHRFSPGTKAEDAR